MNDELNQLRNELRAWSSRSPSRAPAAARARVAARIGERRKNSGWRFAATAVTGVVVLAASILVLRQQTPSSSVRPVAPPHEPPSLVVHELRSGTKVYITLSHAENAPLFDSQPPRGNEG